MNNNYTGRRVLVTGGTGFIGRHLVGELLNQGAQVRVLMRAGTPQPLSWSGRVALCYGDLEDTESLSRACCSVETVFHAAGFAHAWAEESAELAERHWRVNALGTRRLLEAAKGCGVQRLVYFSSVKAMGEDGTQCIDEDWPLPPQTPYGRAKRQAEQWVVEVGQHSGMHVVNLRLALVYGPGGRGNLERMVGAIERGLFPPLPEVGNRRSMVHVLDVVQVALSAADHPVANQKTYILTDGHPYSSREIYDLIRRGLGQPIPGWAVPAGLLRGLAKTADLIEWLRGRRIGFNSEVLDKLLGSACYNSDKIQRELGYRPSWSLAKAIPEILQKQPTEGKAY